MAGGYGAVEHALHVSAPRFEQPRARHGGAVMMALTAAVLVAFGANAGGSRGAASRTLAPGDTSTSCDCDALCAADDSASPLASAARHRARVPVRTCRAVLAVIALDVSITCDSIRSYGNHSGVNKK